MLAAENGTRYMEIDHNFQGDIGTSSCEVAECYCARPCGLQPARVLYESEALGSLQDALSQSPYSRLLLNDDYKITNRLR